MVRRVALFWMMLLVVITGLNTAYCYPTVNVKTQCGAVGNGVANDTAAFQQAASIIQTAGGGTLSIPAGTYLVGGQAAGGGMYRRGQDIFAVSNVNYLLIDGQGAALRLQSGLRFGSFDPATGQPYNPPSLPYQDLSHAAGVGNMISVTNSQNVTIQNLELDGNNTNLVLGGQFGDTGRQLDASGLSLYANKNVQVTGVNSHNHALDGIQIGSTPGLMACDAATPHTLTNCSFTYNARQGLSWVGGIGLTATGCSFSHTGRAVNNGTPFCSSPGAGLDIEAENSVTRNGYFQNCEFVNNTGVGMGADSGDGGYTLFSGCTFWGTTSYSVWSGKPGLKYQDCTFHGTAVHTVGSPDASKATGFLRCTFEDTPWTNGQVYNTGCLLESDEGGDNVSFDNCDFIANACKSIWFGNGHGYFNNCNFLHKWSGAPDMDFMALIRVAKLSGCRFSESFPSGTTKNWSIAVSNTVIANTPTIVDGPRVKWQNWSWGATGTVAPGSYSS